MLHFATQGQWLFGASPAYLLHLGYRLAGVDQAGSKLAVKSAIAEIYARLFKEIDRLTGR